MKIISLFITLLPILAFASGRPEALEKTLEASVGKSATGYQQARGEYWTLIRKSEDYPRAYRFFTGMAERHPDSADALSDSASSIGAFLGWNHDHGGKLTQAEAAKLDGKARAQYSRALELAPEDFWTLFGLATYESHSPGHQKRAQELVTQLEGLRMKYPNNPWPLVDQLKQRVSDAH